VDRSTKADIPEIDTVLFSAATRAAMCSCSSSARPALCLWQELLTCSDFIGQAYRCSARPPLHRAPALAERTSCASR